MATEAITTTRPLIRITEIMDKVGSYIDNPDLGLIQRAYIFSAKAHEGQVRLSGEPYLMHPLNVALILANMRMDEASIAAGLLHDTVEDTHATVDEIEELFGENVADIVDGVTKISLMEFDSKEAAKGESIRKMILAMAEDIRVLIVKLADRLHNLRTLGYQSSAKQRAIAQETMDLYSPLANRLGLHHVKLEMDDLCLKYLKPDIYEQIKNGVSHRFTSSQQYIDQVISRLEKLLAKNKIKGRIFGRAKNVYSIYSKMVRQRLDLDQVHDLIAFRIIVPAVKDCYAVLGLVHAEWMPAPGRFKDYISIPKANMYQSLHTTVIGPEGERIEIQIRTEEMHKIAEYGVAAHWQYKEGPKKDGHSRDAQRFTWLRQILDWQRELKDPREFMASLRFDLFSDEVYVFTPHGEVKELPDGATPVDFAFLIHTEVGTHCSGARVNGKLVPLHTPLTNGDTVEIFTDKNRSPSRDWLKFVKTAKARTRIKQWIRTEERAKAISLGREMLEKEGRRMDMNVAKLIRDGRMAKLAEKFSFTSADDLMSYVGYSRVTPRKVLRRMWDMLRGEGESPQEPEEPPRQERKDGQKTPPKSEAVLIKGVDDVLLRFAGCCNPLPGDPIVGYISRGRGVTIHTSDCPNVKTFEPERIISVSWAGEEDDHPYPAKIKFKCKNTKGVLARVCMTLADQDVNIASGNFSSSVDGFTEMEFTVEVRDADHLYRTISKVTKVDGVLEVSRVS
ncbi:MAG: diphosphokinase / guanosine-3,5-bis(diphosphate) 3-diphosphatase [Desulfovibrionales bacterium]|nr:diphosphokinase / guanosine-3,5-bis(diphosphate) 3-diphosphatase [Desulfovibrionales bacterium]